MPHWWKLKQKMEEDRSGNSALSQSAVRHKKAGTLLLLGTGPCIAGMEVQPFQSGGHSQRRTMLLTMLVRPFPPQPLPSRGGILLCMFAAKCKLCNIYETSSCVAWVDRLRCTVMIIMSLLLSHPIDIWGSVACLLICQLMGALQIPQAKSKRVKDKLVSSAQLMLAKAICV
jgi:hypothetical protein